MQSLSRAFSTFATRVADLVGKPYTFVLALMAVCAWAASGPVFGFSEVWQLVINTGTTIITFLMIFVLQNSQNRDGKAIQAKLDELILTSKSAQNKFIGIEELDESELKTLRQMIQTEACRDSEAVTDIAEDVVDKKLDQIVDRTRSELRAMRS